MNYEALKKIDAIAQEIDLSKEIYENVEINLKYSGYIERQNSQIEQADKFEKIKIPEDINYTEIIQLSKESIERLSKIRPVTLAQASRIGGVNPADISILMIILEARRRTKTEV